MRSHLNRHKASLWWNRDGEEITITEDEDGNVHVTKEDLERAGIATGRTCPDSVTIPAKALAVKMCEAGWWEARW